MSRKPTEKITEALRLMDEEGFEAAGLNMLNFSRFENVE